LEPDPGAGACVIDELTRERYPHGVPLREKRKTLIENPKEIARRRRILNGWEDPEPAPSEWVLSRLARDRELSETLREWVA
jgi:hypothetical protein